MPEILSINDTYTRDVLGSQGQSEEATPPAEPADEGNWRAVMLETLGSLTAGVSRDFQALAQTILEHTLRLKSRLDVTTSALNELLAIETAARRLLQTSGHLQDLSRHSDSLEPLDINEIIRESLLLVQAARGGRPAFSLELEPSAPRINARPTLLTHALITLFLRSAREMPHGGTIRVRTGKIGPTEAANVGLTEACDGALWVAIKDESPGYPFERKEQICRALREGQPQGDAEIRFLQEIVRQHDGAIVLESQAGRGVTWTLYFPALPGNETDISFYLQPTTAAQKGTILLVDDEPLICGMGRRVLETAGFRVITALSGTAAVDAYRRHLDEVDLVLLDVVLPDQGGLEVLKAIRRMNKSARVLISSGYTTEGGIRDMLTETGAGFIQKPYRIKELLAKVEGALGNRE